MKEDYSTILQELSTAGSEDWVRMNMIDFTHTFPAEDNDALDLNYLEGIENLVKILESFLIEEGPKT